MNKSTQMERNVIAKKTLIVGDITSEGDFRIDGTLEGTLKTNGRVIIGAEGLVKGSIIALNAEIEGEISGKLEVKKVLTVKSISKISGEVIVGKLSVEPGAKFNASCTMRVVKDSENKGNAKQQKEVAKKTFK